MLSGRLQHLFRWFRRESAAPPVFPPLLSASGVPVAHEVTRRNGASRTTRYHHGPCARVRGALAFVADGKPKRSITVLRKEERPTRERPTSAVKRTTEGDSYGSSGQQRPDRARRVRHVERSRRGRLYQHPL